MARVLVAMMNLGCMFSVRLGRTVMVRLGRMFMVLLGCMAMGSVGQIASNAQVHHQLRIHAERRVAEDCDLKVQKAAAGADVMAMVIGRMRG